MQREFVIISKEKYEDSYYFLENMIENFIKSNVIYFNCYIYFIS